MIVNNIQPCPKRCLLMPLARVEARTESTTLQLHARRGQFLHTRIDTVRRHAVYARRVLHFSAFILAGNWKPLLCGAVTSLGKELKPLMHRDMC